MPKAPATSATLKMQMKPTKTTTRKKTANAGTDTSPDTSFTANEKPAQPQLSSEQREEMIRYAAYHIAEKDGFKSGQEQEYWHQAQNQIDQLLGAESASEQH